MNKVILVGRLVEDPEIKVSKTGKKVISSSIAVRREAKNAEGNYDSDFINFVAFEKSAEFIANYTHKGDLVALSGRWQTRNYEDKDGKKRVANEVLVETFTSLTKKEAKEAPVNIADEDIPF